MGSSRLRILVATLILLGMNSCSSGGGGGVFGVPIPVPSSITVSPFASVFSAVTVITAAPKDTGRVFMVQQSGVVNIVKHNVLLASPFIDISGEVLRSYEAGLVGMTFAPDYATSGVFYLSYTSAGPELRVRRFHVSASNPDSANALSETPVITVPLPTDIHHSGTMAFGPDGMFYLAVGDGGPQYDSRRTGQDPSDLLGNVLRLNVANSGTYTVPSDNPFVGVMGARGELWSYGLRNPWNLCFDRSTGDLYVPDVGQDYWEEINVGPAMTGRGRGLNYGWSLFEGRDCGPAGVVLGCDSTGITMAAIAWAHKSGANECAAIGGRVYRGRNIPGLAGLYFFSDLCGGWLRSFRLKSGIATEIKDWGITLPDSPSTFGEDANGEIYIGTQGGLVLKLMP